MITHPFVDHSAIEQLSLEELQTKISELSRRRLYLLRVNNPHLLNQLNMVIESHTQVYNAKVSEQWKSMNINSRVDVSHSDKK